MRFAADQPTASAAMALTALTPAMTERWLAAGPTKITNHGRYAATHCEPYVYLQACVEITVAHDLRQLSFELYSELQTALQDSGGQQFIRIWNYIPNINQGSGDQENYRQFCWGRADALGESALPAATGIGSRDGWLRIGALCSTDSSLPVQHLENPRQLSAYKYPREYGPRSPSFARATRINSTTDSNTTAGKSLLLLSGTSSIVDHQTLHAGDLGAQTAETARNIDALLSPMSVTATPLALRYYLRDASRINEARSAWAASFPAWPEPAYFAADICRADLAMEIEAVFSV